MKVIHTGFILAVVALAACTNPPPPEPPKNAQEKPQADEKKKSVQPNWNVGKSEPLDPKKFRTPKF